MNLSAGTKICGFTVTRVRENEELCGKLIEMEYDKTGTQLCWVDNGDSNKLFSITFKTLPEDSTGVFHIIEHSVLCGSDKYPVKDPFVELIKSSMNTFLNALTFSDKTMYPVSSRNEQDFLNLTEVYLDAVFTPNMLREPNVFYQEGWHIEGDGEDIAYNGVVFNEMKGSMNDIDRIIEQKLMEMLYPDNCYRCNSGGDPQIIPHLSYERFCETYRRFYHPSNARIFLDGAVPLEKTLTLLDSYLSRFERSDALPDIAAQQPHGCDDSNSYELAADQDSSGKGYLTLGKIIGGWEDRVRLFAAYVLCDVLAGSNESPLKRAILSSGLAQDVCLSLEDNIAQPFIKLCVKNIKDGYDDQLIACIRDTCAALVRDGISRSDLNASINLFSFRVREPDEPQGLERCINSMSSWLYGGDPLQYIVYNDDIDELRAMLEDDSFERLLEELLVDPEGAAVLHTVPSVTLGEEQRKNEAAALRDIWDGWDNDRREQNRLLNERLLSWQQTADSPEILALLPQLALSEVSETPDFTETLESEVNGVKVLYHPVPCSGIAHITLYFSLADCTLQELTQLSGLETLLGSLATDRHDALSLRREQKNYLGRISFSVTSYRCAHNNDRCKPMLTVKCSVLEENLAKAYELIEEILLHTDFSDKEKLREMLVQDYEDAKHSAISSGHILGILYTKAQYSASHAMAEYTGGYTHIGWMRSFVDNFDNEIAAYTEKLESVLRRAICRERMIVSVTATGPVELSPLIEMLPHGDSIDWDAHYEAKLSPRMGIRIPAQISFAIQGGAMPQDDEAIAHMNVATQLISFGYLWNVVRVQGGAYGTGIVVGKDGTLCTYSYRDPSPTASLAANNGISGFLNEFAESGESTDKYIISTIASTEPLLTPRAKGALADGNFFVGNTMQDLIRQRRYMLDTTAEDIRKCGELLDEFAKTGAVCVVGYDDMLAQFEDISLCSL